MDAGVLPGAAAGGAGVWVVGPLQGELEECGLFAGGGCGDWCEVAEALGHGRVWWNRVGLRVRRVVRGRGEELVVEGEAGLGHWLCLRRVEYGLWSASVVLAGAGLIAVAAFALADGDELP